MAETKIEIKATYYIGKRLLRRGSQIEIIYQCPICELTLLKVIKNDIYTISDIFVNECNHYRVLQNAEKYYIVPK